MIIYWSKHSNPRLASLMKPQLLNLNLRPSSLMKSHLIKPSFGSHLLWSLIVSSSALPPLIKPPLTFNHSIMQEIGNPKNFHRKGEQRWKKRLIETPTEEHCGGIERPMLLGTVVLHGPPSSPNAILLLLMLLFETLVPHGLHLMLSKTIGVPMLSASFSSSSCVFFFRASVHFSILP